MIIESDNNELKFFADCDEGECFSDTEGEFFIKVNKKAGYICDTLLNSAVNLISGELVVFIPKTVVAVHENARIVFK